MGGSTLHKSDVRRIVRARIAAMDPTARASESATLCNVLLQRIPRDTCVCAFVPLPDEPDIRPLLETLLARGTRLFLPRFDGTSLTFGSVTTLADLVPAGTYELLEPAKTAPSLDFSSPLLALIPGVAFDVQGGRIGRGKGAYDRWIGERRALRCPSVFCGIALSMQIEPLIPMLSHDQRMDDVFTPQGTIMSNGASPERSGQ